MRNKFKKSELRTDLVWSAASAFIMALTVLALTAVVARLISAEEFATFAALRSLSATLLSFVTASGGSYLIYSYSKDHKSAHYFSSLVITVLLSGCVTIILFALDLPLLSDSGTLSIIPYFLAILLGVCSVRLYEGYLRGIGKPISANLVKLFLGAGLLWGVMISAFVHRSLDYMILYWAVGSFCVFILVALLAYQCSVFRFENFTKQARSHLKWGLPRSPGGVLKGGMATLGLFQSGQQDPSYAAVFAIGLYLIKLADASLGAFRSTLTRFFSLDLEGSREGKRSVGMIALLIISWLGGGLISIEVYRYFDLIFALLGGGLVNLILDQPYVRFFSILIPIQLSFLFERPFVDVKFSRPITAILLSLAISAQLGLYYLITQFSDDYLFSSLFSYSFASLFLSVSMAIACMLKVRKSIANPFLLVIKIAVFCFALIAIESSNFFADINPVSGWGAITIGLLFVAKCALLFVLVKSLFHHEAPYDLSR